MDLHIFMRNPVPDLPDALQVVAAVAEFKHRLHAANSEGKLI
jgi:hypothetical protein